MGSLSSTGGLTGNWIITATTIATWINSMQARSRVCEAIEEFAGVLNISSEQYVEVQEAKRKKNGKTCKLCFFALETHYIF